MLNDILCHDDDDDYVPLPMTFPACAPPSSPSHHLPSSSLTSLLFATDKRAPGYDRPWIRKPSPSPRSRSTLPVGYFYCPHCTIQRETSNFRNVCDECLLLDPPVKSSLKWFCVGCRCSVVGNGRADHLRSAKHRAFEGCAKCPWERKRPPMITRRAIFPLLEAENRSTCDTKQTPSHPSSSSSSSSPALSSPLPNYPTPSTQPSPLPLPPFAMLLRATEEEYARRAAATIANNMLGPNMSSTRSTCF
eukprot:TRINITY_DN3036_c0_g1_i1.p1 TRINITY_DN3036_c0_g1~~TRINITY_DN3036_c0_g1_i1.p1  ORF type:complete len:248 (-),score=20.13 TRINITY_DN3036_c0_g1_i1:77-820(-)